MRIKSLTILYFLITLACCAIALSACEQTHSNGVANEKSTETKLDLWTPTHVDASQIPLTFTYTSNKTASYVVDLLIKPEGSTEYRKATLDGNSSFESKEGESEFTVSWDKEKDSIQANLSVDLRLTTTDKDGHTTSSDLNRLRFESRETIRNHVQDYLIYYGKWTDSLIDQARQKYRLVIIDTRSGISPKQIAKIRAGKDPHDASDDVLVLAYVSIGEDLRTAGMSPDDMKKDARFVLDGSGPSTDPRAGAPFPKGSDVPKDLDLKGKASNGGFAPFYLNDNFVTFGTIGKAGTPDFNTNFKAAFVNPGHPEWFKALLDMKLQTDKVSGIKELLTRDSSQGYGCDGLFLDTLDTAAPNSFTDASSSNQGQFEWVQPGMKQLIANIRQAYPDRFLLANRGLFFYNPDLTAYAFTLRGLVDFALFESYRLDSSSAQWFNEATFNDNKYNYVQKLLAESDRGNGFRVLSLGYAEGPNGDLMKKALNGEQNEASKMLLADVQEANDLGMVHYISNAQVAAIDTYVIDHRDAASKPPIWGNTMTPPFGKPYTEPRVGIQNIDIRGKNVFVQWDVAHSQARPISYTLYVKEGQDFDFKQDMKNQEAQAIPLNLGIPLDYAGRGDRTKRYPYEDKVEGLASGKTYYFLIRARNAADQFDNNEKSMKIIAP
ncbi:hypothetical protein GC102_00880 [Paenibacillus sp. LMG 31460]|uniref:Fibronectin type-III domain-containing protein n=1 Tax=Paenibacillus germinis TaxID=2654979 RepID=A0ABX1YUV8_9BACL|nr:hypothetical protein [Paenibacillus germinis]NOU84344.1 hypothetical protein [Paenibacillus germinis]